MEQSIFTETIILKGILSHPEYANKVLSVYKKDYFENTTTGQIYNEIQKHYNKYGEVPTSREQIVSVLGEEVNTVFSEIDNVDYNIASNYDHLVDETENYLQKQSIRVALLEAVNIYERGESLDVIIDKVEHARSLTLNDSSGSDYFNDLQSRLIRIFQTPDTRVPTYYHQLDEFISGGFPAKTLSVFVARIHGWKSQLMINLASRQVLNGHNVVCLSLEMSEDEYQKRFDAIHTNMSINKIHNKHFPNDVKNFITRMKSLKEQWSTMDIGTLKVKDFPTGEATTTDYKTYLRKLQLQGFTPDIIYVDYLNLMKSNYRTKNDLYQDVKKVSEELRALAYHFNCPVVSVSQLNREGMRGNLSEIDFTSISESIGVPATADFMAILGKAVEKDIQSFTQQKMYKIVKNRLGGRVGEISWFYYDKESLRMWDSTEEREWIDRESDTGDYREGLGGDGDE